MPTSVDSLGPSFSVDAAVENNGLLRAIPHKEYERIQGSLELVSLPLQQVVSEPGQPFSHLYFLQHGVMSLLALDEQGGAIEVGTIGNEGVAGLAVFHGAESSPHRCFCQVAGAAKRLPVSAFRREGPKLPQLQQRLHRYSQCFFNDVAQSVACNGLHSIDQRCARWLLMTHDRVNRRSFELKQAFLSFMLATRRTSVSAAANKLAKRGLIRYSRGRIEILDREGLEKSACACYGITRAAYDQLLGT